MARQLKLSCPVSVTMITLRRDCITSKVGHNITLSDHSIGCLFSVLILSVLRMAGASRKPYKVLDRTRSLKKGVMASSLEEFISSAQRKLCYEPDTAVVVVLEEDGTEVDEDDYFQTLDPNTCLMLLHAGDRWSPFSAAAPGMSYFCQSVTTKNSFSKLFPQHIHARHKHNTAHMHMAGIVKNLSVAFFVTFIHILML